jgi:hypothetical protein
MDPDLEPRPPEPAPPTLPSPKNEPVVAAVPAERAGPSRSSEPTSRTIVCASIGAFIGALMWSMLMFAAGSENGWFAWVVGALAGGGAMLGGGRGAFPAGAAAAIALAGMAGGRICGTELLVRNELRVREALERAAAAAVPRDTAQQAPAAPMADVAPEPDEGDAVEEESGPEAEIRGLQQKMANNARSLARIDDSSGGLEVWRAQQREALRGNLDARELMRQGVGFLDGLFAVLGLATAFAAVRRERSRIVD